MTIKKISVSRQFFRSCIFRLVRICKYFYAYEILKKIKISPGGSPGSRTKTLVLATRTASSSAVVCPLLNPFIKKPSSPSQTGVEQVPAFKTIEKY